MKQLSPNVNSTQWHKPIPTLRVKNANFPKSKTATTAILNVEKVNSFRKYESVLTKVQQCTPSTNQQRCLESKVQIFQNPSKMAAAAILKFEKVNSFLRDKAIFTTFQQHTLGINHYRSLWSKIIIFQKSKMALTPS